jgi:excisionase family DNA binding protein
MTTQNSTQSHPAAPRLLYSREEAAYQLSISVRSLDYMIAGRKIATQRMGTRILIPHAELVRLATTAQIKSVV